MNDPNGLVYADGEYHLFFQHNPFGDTWGHMSWGHAVSPDLVRWRELGVALAQAGDEAVYSGSVVIDLADTAGFGAGAMVAVFTSARPGSQAQSLASSTDRGRTWTRYAGNPVLDVGSAEFRDPKVFWHAPGRTWVMAVAMATEHRIALYRSPDLKAWTLMSAFGPAGAVDGVWECPDLFPLALDGDPARIRWVLVVNVTLGGVAGGSAAQYFVGDFDGTRFEAGDAETRWLDHGTDYYAAVSFNDAPGGERIMMGWMSNWDYAASVPTSPWRGAMSVPRRIELRTVDGRPQLAQAPVAALDALHAGPPSHTLPARGTALDLRATLRPRTGRSGLRVLAGAEGEETLIGYDVDAGTVFVDRTRSGAAAAALSGFASVQSAPLALREGTVALRVLVDGSLLEVFAGDGVRVIAAQVFPSAGADAVSAFGDGTVESLDSYTMHGDP